MRRSKRFFALAAAVSLMLCGCQQEKTIEESRKWKKNVEKPAIPEKLDTNNQGVPVLDVYDVASEKLEKMDIEAYVTGVVAGEMKNDWPIEALKAQAILARTFVLKFCDTKESQYDDADISTDVKEAQAYAPDNINERVEQAIEETRGMVMSADGDYPYAWFFAHSGGATELPSVALEFGEKDPDYLSVVDSPDSAKAPEDVRNWKVTFSSEEVLSACRDIGLDLDSVQSISIGEKGESGRAKTLIINKKNISAPSFRIAIGANRLKSTLISDVELNGDLVTFTGKGFGHGVGMSQWGAYALAEEGKSAQEIIEYYCQGVDLVKLW